MTTKEARAFAAELEAAVQAGEPAAVAKVMRLPEVLDRAGADLGLSPADRTKNKAQTDKAAVALAKELLDQVAAGGRYDLVRVRKRDGQPVALFRLIQPAGGVNYHEYPLVRHPDGVGPADLHVMATGEPVSATLRRLFARVAAEHDRGLFDRLSGAERLFTDNLPKIEAMTAHRRAGQPVSVLNVFRSLPPALRADKGLLINAMSAAGQVSDRDYLDLAEQFEDAYPGDPALDLLNIDTHLVRREYTKSLAALDRLDQRVGGDPYLDLPRANVLTLAGKPAAAQAAAERLVEWASDEEWGYQAGVEAAASAGDHPGVLAWLKRGMAAGAMGTYPDLVRTHELFAGFRRSSQFAELKKWLAGQAKRSDPAR